MYLFYMILFQCRLTNVCYLRQIWMTIRLRSGRGNIGPTRLKRLSLRRAPGEKTRVDINVNTREASSPNVEKFNNYLGVVSRERLSILINSWDEVSKIDRNML